MAGFMIARLPTAFALDPSSKATRRVQDKQHLAFIRTLRCAIGGGVPVEACHVRSGSAEYGKKHTGMGQKPDDKWVVPLSPDQHRLQHSMNELDYWNERGIDPFRLASRLFAVSRDHDAAIDILRENWRGVFNTSIV